MSIKTNMRTTTPTGVIEQLSGSNAALPAGYAICNGQEVNKTTYAKLFAIIGNTYGTPVNPANMVLPDLRGMFVRGLDSGRGVDTGRALGTTQADAFKAHQHTYLKYGAVNLTTDGGSHYYGTTEVPTGNSGGTETRPYNLTAIFIIKL